MTLSTHLRPWPAFFAIVLTLSACIKNEPPIADAGNDTTVDGFSVVKMDGLDSRDPNGDALRYKWTLNSKPALSTVELEDAADATPSFSPDQAGKYEFALSVDDGSARSNADRVTITVTGLKADPGHNQTVAVGASVKLDGTHSRSLDDGNNFNYEWAFAAKPKDSAAMLDNKNIATPSFTTDLPGKYTLQLIIHNEPFKSQAALLYVRTSGIAVDGGGNQSVAVGATVALSATKSKSGNGGTLTYDWSFLSRPTGSKAAITNAKTMNASFVADVAGNYMVRLLVGSAGENASTQVSVVAGNAPASNFHAGQHFDAGHCAMCHNGSDATGKPANHIAVADACGACHGTVSWLPVQSVVHEQVIGTCVSCHNGTQARGKSATHIASTNNCDSCHSIVSFVPVVVVDHNQVLGACDQCHNNMIAKGQPSNHVKTTKPCDACHTTQTWIQVLIDHTQITAPCASCHNGTTASGKSLVHIPTTNACETCHATTNWLAVSVDHSQVIGTCASCHNGVLGSGKSVAHPVTNKPCEDCHSTNAWVPTLPSPPPTPATPASLRTVR